MHNETRLYSGEMVLTLMGLLLKPIKNGRCCCLILGDARLNEARTAVLSSMKSLGELLAKASDSALKDDVRIDTCARLIAVSIGKIYGGAFDSLF